MRDSTYLGAVINVTSSDVEVEISRDIPSATPIIGGRLYKLGQIGTFVKFPLGGLTLYGIVSSVSNSPSKPKQDLAGPDYGARYLHVQLVGERLGEKPFDKGVGTYPTINDDAHVVTEEDLRTIYGGKEEGCIEIGNHASCRDLPVHVDIHKLVLRHSALLGSTGSGKSNTVARVVDNILSGHPGSRILLVDIHGEYEAAFPTKAEVFRINDKEHPLCVPFWTMTFDELAFFLVGRPEGQERPEDKRLRDTILQLKKANATALKAGAVHEEYITADSPIPFDLRKLWYDLDRQVNATYNHNSDQKTENECLVKEGDAQKLVPATFTPYSPTNTAPYKSKDQTMYPYVGKIYSKLKDSRFDFMLNPGKYADPVNGCDIDELLRTWIANDKRLTILDLSGVPYELTDVSVGLITRFIFDSMYWGRFEEYTGRNRPLLMIYEEAHSYLPKDASGRSVYGYARKAVERIFKEGRKFGIGAMVVSQRPSEVSETILAQAGTFIALRLTNSSDKSTVQSAAPNNMSTLMELLPALRIGEAVVVGEAIKIPSRVRIKVYDPRPSSRDPDLVNAWKKEFKPDGNHYKTVVTAIREQAQYGGAGNGNG